MTKRSAFLSKAAVVLSLALPVAGQSQAPSAKAGHSAAVPTAKTAAAKSAAHEPAAGVLPDGRYTCLGMIGASTVTFGFVDIKGQTYRGPSHSPSGAYAPFTIGADNAITWSRGFGEFNRDNGVTYKSAALVPGKARFKVSYTTARGYSENLDCGRE